MKYKKRKASQEQNKKLSAQKNVFRCEKNIFWRIYLETLSKSVINQPKKYE